jgi:site-specific DNA-methyltransferase (adenine-specific)
LHAVLVGESRCVSEMLNACFCYGSLIVFMSIIKAGKLVELAEDTKLYYKTTGVWHKTNPMPRNMNLHFINSTEAWLYFVNESLTGTFNNSKLAIHDFIETPTISKKEKRIVNHPTQKPIALIDHFVRILSNPNDVVLDPFMGSGSTGVSSINLNRKFIGIELSTSYFKLTQKRIKEDCK